MRSAAHRASQRALSALSLTSSAESTDVDGLKKESNSLREKRPHQPLSPEFLNICQHMSTYVNNLTERPLKVQVDQIGFLQSCFASSHVMLEAQMASDGMDMAIPL